MRIHPSLLRYAVEDAAFRRDIHAHPELGFDEHRTAKLVAERLRSWGIETHTGIGGTGVVGVIKKGTSQRSIALRADMDALPITEQNRFEHASQHPGKMHACGHDGHTATLLAAARVLAQETKFDGTVVLVFQPAEELGSGAKAMIEDGLFDRFGIDQIYGFHNWPGLDTGHLAICDGPCFASANRFSLVLKGKAAHAAMPHLGCDPVVAGCQLVQSFQTVITRNKRPIDTAVISVTQFHAGEVSNAIPDRCHIAGSVRALSPDVLVMIKDRMTAMAQATAEMFGLQAEWMFSMGCPPTINHPASVALARQVMLDLAVPSHVHLFEPTMAAEDFGYFLQVKPGAYFVLGNGLSNSGQTHELCMLHQPSYDFNDAVIVKGATFWIQLVLKCFESSHSSRRRLDLNDCQFSRPLMTTLGN